jgi:hypothetical protein
MHPQTPQDRRAFESPDWTAPEPQNDHTRIEDRSRWFQGRAMLATFLLLIAIFALIVLL